MSKATKILLPLGVLLLGIAAAVALVVLRPEVETREPETPPPLVQVIEAEPRSLSLDVPSQGTVTPRTASTLVAQVAGRVQSVSPAFAQGGVVRPGQVLVRLDPRDYELAVRQARAQVAQAETRLAREEAEAEVAREEWRQLAADEAESGPGGEPPEASPLVLREPQLAEARAALDAAEASLAQAELNLERTRVEAPFLGRVRTKQVDVGQAVSPGTPLGSLYAVDYAEVLLPVPVGQLAYLDLDLTGSRADGPAVELTAELAGARRTWSGRVVRTDGEIDPQTRMLSLVVRVDSPYGRAAEEAGVPLPVGLFVEATVDGRDVDGVFSVPRAALRGTGRREGEPALVLVVDDDERLRFREVEVVRLARDEAILGQGLAAGDRVLVSPFEAPVDGMEVRADVVSPGEAPEDRSDPTGQDVRRLEAVASDGTGGAGDGDGDGDTQGTTAGPSDESGDESGDGSSPDDDPREDSR